MLSAVGIIIPVMTPVPYWVWKFEWPQVIQDAMITAFTPIVTLTFNDIELAGLFLGGLVL